MRLFYIGLIGLLLLGCTPEPVPMTEIPVTIEIPTETMTPQPPVTPTTELPTETPVPVPDVVLVGAGDIAGCSSDGDEATAKLLDSIPGTVFTTGDNAYPSGTMSEFLDCYDPSWGRHKARTYPSSGNHDYGTQGAAGYYAYFGSVAGDPDKGYYSYDLGSWHIVVLNSNIQEGAGSDQEQWLRADLAAHPVACTLAYWHHPRFSSGDVHGSDGKMQSLWQALYDFGADVVLNGHEHNYERFALQDPRGTPIQFAAFASSWSEAGDAAITRLRTRWPTVRYLTRIHTVFSNSCYIREATAGNSFQKREKRSANSGAAPCVSVDLTASSDILIFTPSDDATIKSAEPDTNFGFQSQLEADNVPYDNFLLKFDVSGINNRSVLSAKLRLHNVNDSDSGGNVYYVTDNSWSESSVTWNTAPLSGSTLVGSIGLVTKHTWYEIDLTSLIKSDGFYSFRVSTTSNDGADYKSKEGEGGLAPQLIVSVVETMSP